MVLTINSSSVRVDTFTSFIFDAADDDGVGDVILRPKFSLFLNFGIF